MPKHFSWFLSLFSFSWMKNLTSSMLKITQEWVYKTLREWSSQNQTYFLLLFLSFFYYNCTDGASLPLLIYFLSMTPRIPPGLNHVKHWEEKRHCILFRWMSPPKLLAVLIFIPLESDPEKKPLNTTNEVSFRSGGDKLRFFSL